MPGRRPRADLETFFRKHKANAFIIQSLQFRFHPQQFAAIHEQEIFEFVGMQHVAKIIGFGPQTVQSIAHAWLRFGQARYGPIVFAVLEIKQQGAVFEIDVIQLVDKGGFGYDIAEMGLRVSRILRNNLGDF